MKYGKINELGRLEHMRFLNKPNLLVLGFEKG